ncbi:hypothetical protein [Nocardioides sp.]|uniref:hypothetical protein n=1 Tax=Nocardioides sp. TaxID=35761 RepID=UPI002B27ADA3|nr:hypothetical protein [Nocardioides sp.]
MPDTAEPDVTAEGTVGPEDDGDGDVATHHGSGASEPPAREKHRAGPQRPSRPNSSAWLMALTWAALTAVVLLPFAIDGRPDRSFLASVAAVGLPALAVAAVTSLVAHRSASAWSWWLYPPIVVLPAVALVVLTDLVPDRLENVPDVGDQGNRSLAAPDQAGAWTLRKGASADEQEAELRGRILRADESLEAVYGDYRRGGDDVLVYNGINVTTDSDLARELVGRPETALGDYLEGTGITDVVEVPAGDLRGAMACGTFPRLGPYVDLIVCGWADSGGIGTAIYRVDGINQELAAETTREFRAEVTVYS